MESYRGVKPRGLSVFDEFEDFRPEFFGAYDPNRAAHDSPFLLSEPPDRECQFLTVAMDFQANDSKRFFKAPSHEKPTSQRTGFLKKHELITRGEEDVWQREYSSRVTFPGFLKYFYAQKTA